jgi:tRNA(Leu) C34 or U34 (ribose-2'-O)-methylase TrmL
MKEEPCEFELGNIKNIKKDQAIFDEKFLPAIVLTNPKYPHNVGATIRASSNFGAKLLIFTGNRVSLDPPHDKTKYRLPREERMKDYKEIVVLNDEYPFNRFSCSIIPVAVELRHNSENLKDFIHPENAVYVFGPEDGSISTTFLRHCYRFVKIPSRHCLNLAAAVNVILYDRLVKNGV